MTRTRMTTRLPDALQEALAARAEANHRSTNAELIVILTQALSGTPATPTHTQERAQLAQEWCDLKALQAQYDLTPYKVAIRRLIDDSKGLRAKYEDLDEAVNQAEVLL